MVFNNRCINHTKQQITDNEGAPNGAINHLLLPRVDKLFAIQRFLAKHKADQEQPKDDDWQNLAIRHIRINDNQDE